MMTGDVPCQSSPQKVWCSQCQRQHLLPDRAAQCALIEREEQGFSVRRLFGERHLHEGCRGPSVAVKGVSPATPYAIARGLLCSYAAHGLWCVRSGLTPPSA